MTGSFADEPVYIAIIIDDIGHNFERGTRAINLPGSITYAVLPHSRYSEYMSENASLMSKEVIVHLPMANISHLPIGPGGLTESMNKKDFLENLANAIDQVPHATGINNHTGSYLTQQTKQMTWLMDEIKRRDFFFIDSRTTPNSVAQRIASEKNILTSGRDVFLDNDRSFYAVDRAFRQLIQLAKKRGAAIGICHPYEVTLDYLERAIPHLEQQGVKIIPASNLIALQQIRRMAAASLGE